MIGYLSIHFEWEVIFIIIGLAGLAWLIPWMILVKAPPKNHPWITEEEREYILTGQKNEQEEEAEYTPSVGKLLSHKQTIAIGACANEPDAVICELKHL